MFITILGEGTTKLPRENTLKKITPNLIFVFLFKTKIERDRQLYFQH